MFISLENTVKYAYVDLEESENQTMNLIVKVLIIIKFRLTVLKELTYT